MNKTSIIFDLDNTVIQSSEHYAAAKREFSIMTSEKVGISQDLALEILETIDAHNVKIDGFGRSRFPKSFQAASVAIDVLTERPIDEVRAKKSWAIGDGVFKAKYELYPGAYETLLKVKSMRFGMYMCTKGDLKVQLKKIRTNKLDAIFPIGHIYIDKVKNETHFLKIMKEHNLDPAYTIIIGDSMKDDIGSANKLGVRSIHVIKQQVQWWTGVENGYKPTFEIDYFNDLVDLLPELV